MSTQVDLASASLPRQSSRALSLPCSGLGLDEAVPGGNSTLRWLKEAVWALHYDMPRGRSMSVR